ncbi:MAG: hypothetical protein HY927_10405 [Elusimicrobia bacterium]|nr:hypothetical protein [Elusimicrobiota bacterium]
MTSSSGGLDGRPVAAAAGLVAAAAAAAIAVHCWMGWGMIRASAATYDEPVHLAAGYQNLVAGTYRLNAMDHPPFAEMWGALPLLVLRPSALFQHQDLLARRVYNFADAFLYKNRLPAGLMLDAGRLWCLLTWGTLLGVALMAWAYRLAGGAGLAAAAAFYAFCPTLISNAALVTTDGASATLFFVTFWLLSAVPAEDDGLAQGGQVLAGAGRSPLAGGGLPAWRWAAAGAAMGLAMAAKFNMFILPGLVAVMLLARRRIEPGRSVPRPRVVALAAAACLALALVYRFHSVGLYGQGLRATLSRLGDGRASFLFGQHSTQGWIGYFPAALLVKTPIPLLAMAVLGFGLWVRFPDARRLWAGGPAVAYFVAALFSKTQIGVRHILPVYPFMILMASDGVAWAWKRSAWARAAVAAMMVWLAASVIRVHPHHLAYFNEAAGGPANGYRCLVDSNLDWGQGLKELSGILKEMGDPPVRLCYFGVADPSYYGIRHKPFWWVTNVDRREGVVEPGRDDRVLLAVSATNLQSTYYARKDSFEWLKTRRPLRVAGYSIFLYDLTDDPEGRAKLAAIE